MSRGSSSPTRDPYTTLGLDHNASPTQIKVAYRKLALQYHPDRQRQQQQSNNPQQQEEATTKFAAISSAYAILSDPAKKSQYDHLYKFGAFDDSNDGSDPISEMRDAGNGGTYNTSYRTNTHAATSGSGYKYTENLSGGYYTNKASTGNNNTTSSASSTSAPTASAPPPFFNFIGLKKQDSFFDELLHTPKKKKASSSSSPPFQNNNCEEQAEQQQPRTIPTAQQNQPQQKRSGIGFSIKPLGKHLSIHVPSKSEIISSMASGEPLPHHNFGTRVTFSTSEARSTSKHRSSSNTTTTTSLISTTTRIAHGQQRTVKRTVYIQPDGKKEEVIEENGVVKRRHVEELCPPPPQPSSAAGGGKDPRAQPNEWKENNQAAASCHGWHSLRDCVLGPCLGLQGV